LRGQSPEVQEIIYAHTSTPDKRTKSPDREFLVLRYGEIHMRARL